MCWCVLVVLFVLVCFGVFWCVLVCFGVFWCVLVRFGLVWCVLVCFGAFWFVLVCVGALVCWCVGVFCLLTGRHILILNRWSIKGVSKGYSHFRLFHFEPKVSNVLS